MVPSGLADCYTGTSVSTTITITGDTTPPPELDRFTVPLLLAKRGTDILFTWQDLGGSPTSYNVYQGTLRLFSSHAPLACNTNGSAVPPSRREAVLAPGAGNLYYLMTAANCAAEGPSGADPALSTCPP